MADNLEQGQEVIIGNRRMRKIKRPKPQATPISAPAQPELQNTLTPYQEPADQKDNSASSGAVPPYVEDDSYVYENDAYQEQFSPVRMLDHKKAFLLSAVCLIVGIVFGKFLFGAPKLVQQGLQGVVLNSEVPKGRSRCGMVEKTQGCVLYIMNPQRQEMNGRDFFDLAASQTGRQRFVIETGNMRYSSVKIKPGSIAQLNIPPL